MYILHYMYNIYSVYHVYIYTAQHISVSSLPCIEYMGHAVPNRQGREIRTSLNFETLNMLLDSVKKRDEQIFRLKKKYFGHNHQKYITKKNSSLIF